MLFKAADATTAHLAKGMKDCADLMGFGFVITCLSAPLISTSNSG